MRPRENHGLDRVAIDRKIRLVGDPHIGAGILHDLLHAQVNVVAHLRITFDETLLVQFVELRILPALPIPHADLVGHIPLGHLAWIGRIAEAHDPELKILPLVALFFDAQVPERPGIHRRDIEGNADIRKIGLNDLRGRQIRRLIENLDVQRQTRNARLGKQCLGLLDIRLVESASFAMTDQARGTTPCESGPTPP